MSSSWCLVSEAASRVANDPPEHSVAHTRSQHQNRLAPPAFAYRVLQSSSSNRSRPLCSETRSLCFSTLYLFPICSCARRVRAEYNEVFADMRPSAPAVRRVLDECVVGALPGRDLLGRRVLYLRSGAHSPLTTHSHPHTSPACEPEFSYTAQTQVSVLSCTGKWKPSHVSVDACIQCAMLMLEAFVEVSSHPSFNLCSALTAYIYAY